MIRPSQSSVSLVQTLQWQKQHPEMHIIEQSSQGPQPTHSHSQRSQAGNLSMSRVEYGRDIWKCTLEKSQTNVTDVRLRTSRVKYGGQSRSSATPGRARLHLISLTDNSSVSPSLPSISHHQSSINCVRVLSLLYLLIMKEKMCVSENCVIHLSVVSVYLVRGGGQPGQEDKWSRPRELAAILTPLSYRQLFHSVSDNDHFR